MPGAATSTCEVTRRTGEGFWLRIDQRECFLAYADFPWFEGVDDKALRAVERPLPEQLRWPLMDLDLAVESITNPERYPLVAKR